MGRGGRRGEGRRGSRVGLCDSLRVQVCERSRHGFDALVIAHNGKCAQRLTSPGGRQPALALHALLRAKFGAELPNPRRGGGMMQLNSIYSVRLGLAQCSTQSNPLRRFTTSLQPSLPGSLRTLLIDRSIYTYVVYLDPFTPSPPSHHPTTHASPCILPFLADPVPSTLCGTSLPAFHPPSSLPSSFAAPLSLSHLRSLPQLLFELPEGVIPASVGDAAFVAGEASLRWLSNNTAKHGAGGHTSHVWTALSSGTFGSEHKHPQARPRNPSSPLGGRGSGDIGRGWRERGLSQ